MIEFNAQFFTANRERLMQSLPDSLIVISAHSLLQESADLSYPFRQDSSFWYLTGIDAPDHVLVLDTKKAQSYLLVAQQNEYQKEWEGEARYADFSVVSGVKSIRMRTDLSSLVKDAKKRKLQICYLDSLADRVEPYGFYANPARRLLKNELLEFGADLRDVRIELARLRQQKQPSEIAAMKEAIRITGESLDAVKKRLSEFKTEKELERAITAEFYARGADGHAYQPIVASGKNASVIHYEANSKNLIEKDAILLIDVGAKVQGYAADISRSWAVGKITDEHRAIYDATIELQDMAFSMLKTGVMMKEYQKSMEAEAAKKVAALGFEPRDYPHGFSHFLGLDVHDAGDYASPLVENSVLTVEPGLYFAEKSVGVRIEDNIVITDSGISNLSSDISRSL